MNFLWPAPKRYCTSLKNWAYLSIMNLDMVSNWGSYKRTAAFKPYLPSLEYIKHMERDTIETGTNWKISSRLEPLIDWACTIAA